VFPVINLHRPTVESQTLAGNPAHCPLERHLPFNGRRVLFSMHTALVQFPVVQSAFRRQDWPSVEGEQLNESPEQLFERHCMLNYISLEK